MGFYDLISDFEGIAVENFERDKTPGNLADKGWRITIDWEAYEDGVKFSEELARLLALPGASDIEAFVVGCWEGGAEGGDCEEVIEALVSARDQLPNLKHLFIGEILQEECEASWINLSDISPLFLAFPNLETLRVRGSEGLSLGRPVHQKLRHLALEGGGLPDTLIREICSADLPSLEHLELWLGDDNYGRSVTKEDLQPILDGKFPHLKYLGLRNDTEIDNVVGWLKDAKVLEMLETLDLSLGCLSNEGAAELARNESLKNLKQLNVFHHFMTEEGTKQLKSAFPDVEIDARGEQEADEYDGEIYRYNFVSE